MRHQLLTSECDDVTGQARMCEHVNYAAVGPADWGKMGAVRLKGRKLGRLDATVLTASMLPSRGRTDVVVGVQQ